MDTIRLPGKWKGWSLVSELGEGGQSQTYLINKEETDQKAVIKVTVIEKETFAEALSDMADLQYQRKKETVRKEIKILEDLKDCRHVTRLLDYDIQENDDGCTVFLMLEYLQDFWAWFHSKPYSQELVIACGMQICEGAIECQAHQLLHCDIKPDNLLVSADGTVKFTDFGISGEPGLVPPGSLPQGTLLYMAPELMNGRPYSVTTEIYSIGLVLYQMTNKSYLPFIDTAKRMIMPSDQQKSVRERCSGTPLPRPMGISDDLFDCIQKAAAFDPAERYSSYQELRDQLAAINGTSKKQGAGKLPAEEQAPVTQPAKANGSDNGAEQVSANTDPPNEEPANDDNNEKENKKPPTPKIPIPLILGGILILGAILAGVLLMTHGKGSENRTAEVTEDAYSAETLSQGGLSEDADSDDKSENPESQTSGQAEGDGKETAGTSGEGQDDASQSDFVDISGEYHCGDSIENGDLVIHYIACGRYTDPDDLHPSEDTELIAFQITYENHSADASTLTFDSDDFSCLADGLSYRTTKQSPSFDHYLTSGRYMVGLILFELPVGSKEIVMQYEPTDHSASAASLIYDQDTEVAFTPSNDYVTDYVPEELTAATDTCLQINESGSNGDLEVTLTNVQDHAETRIATVLWPVSGYHYAACTFRVSNQTGEEVLIDCSDFLLYADDRAFPWDAVGTSVSSEYLSAKATGSYTFYYLVPDDAETLEIEYLQGRKRSKQKETMIFQMKL